MGTGFEKSVRVDGRVDVMVVLDELLRLPRRLAHRVYHLLLSQAFDVPGLELLALPMACPCGTYDSIWKGLLSGYLPT